MAWDKDTLGSKVSFTGRAKALVYLKPVLDITVYKMFTVAFVFKIGYELAFLLEVSTDFTAVECSANLKKSITLDVALNASANFFGRHLFGKTFKLYTNKWLLDEDTEDCSLTPEITTSTLPTMAPTTSSVAASAPQTDDGCACKQSWTLTSGASCADYCCTLEGHDRHLCIKEDPSCGTNNWGYCPQLTDDGCLCQKSWESNGVKCHDYCCNLEGFGRHLCIKEDPNCGTGTWDYCPAPRAQDGCRCKQTWSTTSGTDCRDFCCTVDGYDPQLCFKEDSSCGSNSWDYCLPPRTEDGCKCLKVWTSNGVTCNDYCCYLEGLERHLCIKEDSSCGSDHWGYCTLQESSSRRLATCAEVQFFCNQNACENGQPDCHRCGFCDSYSSGTTAATTSPATVLGTTSVFDGATATTATSATSSTASFGGSNTFELGTLWRGRIWDNGGSCSAFSADLVLQLVQFDDFGHGDGILYFMGATNPVALGSCSVTMFYEASVRGSLPYSTLRPQNDIDFFGECESFSLPYGWVVQINSQRIHGIDSMNCMHIDLRAVTTGDMLTDPATTTASAAGTSTIPETSANPATTTTSATITMSQTSFVTSSDEAHSTTTGSALIVGDGVNVTTPLTLEANTTWTAGLHTLGSTMTVLPGVTLIIQGNASIPAATDLVQSRFVTFRLLNNTRFKQGRASWIAPLVRSATVLRC